ncbi:helix-turn-helix domain-containing protein [Nocardia xishanensis]|uniref:helix-turn-helix domain-containing protein n=1 Tax=Nocardia xishanensis TaxID=238964 RepID=UPI0008319342|nr:helix-turn-helix domain-containing protein [Nocardia xishanensis]
MSQNPAHRSPITRRRRPHARIPTFGSICRLIREDLGLSLVKAYTRHGIAKSTLADIENGFLPTLETVDRIIAGYEVDPLMARHLRELLAPAEDLPPTDNLRQCVRERTAAVVHLRDLDDRGVLAAYIDPLWNMLACNESFRAAVPGLTENEQIHTWLFSPPARNYFLDWPSEATHAVASSKTILGRYRDSTQAQDFMQILGQNPEFVDFWTASIRVAYGRNTGDLVHVRDPATGEPVSYSLSISNVTQTEHVLLVTAIRKPYSGPAPDHPRHPRDTLHDTPIAFG